MTFLEKNWVREVQQSRLVILPGQASYLRDIELRVWDLIEQLGDGLTLAELKQTYPGLTETDVRACRLFVYLRLLNKL